MSWTMIAGTVHRKSFVSSAPQDFPFSLTIDPRPGYEKYLTEHYRAIGRKSDARWIFFLDCDEFLLFPRGRKTLSCSLDPEINSVVFRVRDMYPRVQSRTDSSCLATGPGRAFLDLLKWSLGLTRVPESTAASIGMIFPMKEYGTNQRSISTTTSIGALDKLIRRS